MQSALLLSPCSDAVGRGAWLQVLVQMNARLTDMSGKIEERFTAEYSQMQAKLASLESTLRPR